MHNEGWEAVQERRKPDGDALGSAHNHDAWRGIWQAFTLHRSIAQRCTTHRSIGHRLACCSASYSTPPAVGAVRPVHQKSQAHTVYHRCKTWIAFIQCTRSMLGQIPHAGVGKSGLEIKQWWTFIRYFFVFHIESWLLGFKAGIGRMRLLF